PPAVLHLADHRDRRASDLIAHIQLKLERIDLQGLGVRFQPQAGARGRGGHDVKEPAAREAMPWQVVSGRAQPVATTRQVANSRKEDRGTSGPNRRIAVPQKIPTITIPQYGALGTQGLDL